MNDLGKYFKNLESFDTFYTHMFNYLSIYPSIRHMLINLSIPWTTDPDLTSAWYWEVPDLLPPFPLLQFVYICIYIYMVYTIQYIEKLSVSCRHTRPVQSLNHVKISEYSLLFCLCRRMCKGIYSIQYTVYTVQCTGREVPPRLVVKGGGECP